MKLKTKDLTGAALDWAVAKCEGIEVSIGNSGTLYVIRGYSPIEYKPRKDWSQGGPIMGREISRVFKNVGGTYSAQIEHEIDHPLVAHKLLAGWTNASGPTMLAAAMRCWVISKLGDEIDVPEELL